MNQRLETKAALFVSCSLLFCRLSRREQRTHLHRDDSLVANPLHRGSNQISDLGLAVSGQKSKKDDTPKQKPKTNNDELRGDADKNVS